MKVVSVIFKPNGKEYYFSCDDKIKVKSDDKVVVNTARGLELGTIFESEIKKVAIAKEDLMPVIRLATNKDLSNYENNKVKAKKAYDEFNEILQNHNSLEMTLVSAEYSLDQSKLLFMYVSDDRVDFRDLLKSLAAHFKKRIELKQIGSRDKAKLVGGLGPCGMETCCSRYLKDFDNISINMAKNQMLSLNPTKISGLCGRLLCCLKYENDTYTKEKAKFPKIGSKVTYQDEQYKVTGLNILIDEIKIENGSIIKLVNKEEIKW